MMTTAIPKPPKRLREIVTGVGVGAGVLVLVVFMGLRFGALPGTGGGQGALSVGTVAPDFNLPTPAGETIHLQSLQGSPVWVTFWATWCPPCRTEMPDLQQTYLASTPGSYHYIALNFGERESDVQNYLEAIGYTLPVAIDPTGMTAVQYGVTGLPTHIFIDRAGIVSDVYIGVMSSAQMKERVQVLW